MLSGEDGLWSSPFHDSSDLTSTFSCSFSGAAFHPSPDQASSATSSSSAHLPTSVPSQLDAEPLPDLPLPADPLLPDHDELDHSGTQTYVGVQKC